MVEGCHEKEQRSVTNVMALGNATIAATGVARSVMALAGSKQKRTERSMLTEVERKRLYSPPKPIDLTTFADIMMHQRYRVVVHDCDGEGAIAKAEEISERSACDLETFVAYVDTRTGECLGEVTVHRKFYPCKGAMTFAADADLDALGGLAPEAEC